MRFAHRVFFPLLMALCFVVGISPGGAFANPKPVLTKYTRRGVSSISERRLSPSELKRLAIRDIAPVPNFNTFCSNLSPKTFKECVIAAVSAINNAHQESHIPLINVNVANLEKLNGPETLLAAVNFERMARGLKPFAGLTRFFDQVARKAAEEKTDPSLSNKELTLGANGYVSDWGGNWAENVDSPLAANYDFVYQDGPGEFNLLCTPQNSSGCYGHRENILGPYPYSPDACGNLKSEALMGASVLNHHPGYNNPSSITELFVGICVKHPIKPYVSWSYIEKELLIGNSLLATSK